MRFRVGSSTCIYVNNPHDEDFVEVELTAGIFDRSYNKERHAIVYKCDRTTLLNYLSAPWVISDWGILAERPIMEYLNIGHQEAVPMMIRYLWHIKQRIPNLPPRRLWTIAWFFGYHELIQEAHDLTAFDQRFEEMVRRIERRLCHDGVL